MEKKELVGRLVAASRDGLLEQVRSLLDGNQFEEFDLLSGLHEALRKGHVEVIREYVKRGLSTNAVFKKRSLVSNACVHGQPEVLELLLESGADVNPEKQSPLLGATHLGHNIGWDFYRPAPNTIEQMVGHDPLPTSWNEKEIKRRRNELVRILLKYKVKTEVLSIMGHSPLYQCCEEQITDVVQMMAESGCDLEFGTRKCTGPLFMTCQLGHLEVARILIKNGADVRRRDVEQIQTCLHVACALNHFEIAKLLLEAGADVDAADADLNTPLMLASIKGHVQVARLLLTHGARVNLGNKLMITAMHFACTKGKVEMMKLLAENGADLTATDHRMFSPMFLALHGNKRTAAELLRSLGVDINGFDRAGFTMMHLACRLNDIKVVNGLIQMGADVNKMDAIGNCPLHYASGGGRTEAVKALLNNGAEVNKKNRFYQTALFIACGSGSEVKEELVLALLRKGADINIANDSGVTPVACARNQHRPDLEKLLVKYGADVSSLPPPPRKMEAGDYSKQIDELLAKLQNKE